jgi:hypothetical protein
MDIPSGRTLRNQCCPVITAIAILFTIASPGPPQIRNEKLA